MNFEMMQKSFSGIFSVFNPTQPHMVHGDQDRQAVQQLILSEKVSGTVEEWLPGYQMELAAVKRRRLSRAC